MISEIPKILRRKGDVAVAILLLALMAVLSGGAVLRESPAFDEYAHIGAGLSYVQKFDLRLNPEHPPLAKALSGLSLAISGARADYTGPAWRYSNEFFAAFMGQRSFGQWVISRWNDPAKVLFWARLPMLMMTLLLGWVLFVCGKRLGGVWGGLLCLTVYVSAPIFLVFGPLVLTDIPIALFSVLTIWSFGGLLRNTRKTGAVSSAPPKELARFFSPWRRAAAPFALWSNPDRRGVFLFSLSLAGAFLSKFSAPILLLGVLTAAVTMRWMTFEGGPTTKAERKDWWKVRLRVTGKALLWTTLLVYAFYFVFSWNQPTDGLARLGSSVPALMLRRLLLPPVIYLQGMILVLFTFSRSTYLFGREYPNGAWFFYPVAFALKSQLGFQGLLLLGCALGFARRLKPKVSGTVIPEDLRLLWRTIWVTLMVFAAVCVLSHFDISIRHFSVPAALLVLVLAPVPRMVQEMRARSNFVFYASSLATAGLALSCLVTTVRACPWLLPYVNALGGTNPRICCLPIRMSTGGKLCHR